ncbi:MAG: invasion associated locus B family protein [Pseudomonadota bacterium]
MTAIHRALSRLGATILGIGLFVAAMTPAMAQQQGELRETFGDWELRCVAGSDECAITQIGKTADGQDVMEVQIRKVANLRQQDGNQVPALIVVSTPLEVALKAGMRIQVDGEGNTVGLPYERCFQRGCVVVEAMSDQAVDTFKQGNAATFTMVIIPNTEVRSNISLRGFTRAFNALKPTGG